MKNTLLTFILFISITAIGQNADEELGAWYTYGGKHKIAAKWNIKSLAHFRLFETSNDLQQLLIRLGGSYSFNKIFSTTLGYAYLNTDSTYKSDGGEANEHRIYEDLNINHKLSSLSFGHRFRFEQRFLETDTRHWFRYQIHLSHPITSNLSAYFFEEIFLNSQDKTYAQNWVGAGINYKINNTLKLNLGYLSIQQSAANFDRIQLGITINTTHYKNK